MEFCQNNNIKKEDLNRNAIVFGALLGDAHISKDGRLHVWHSIKQKEYTLWLMNIFSKFFKVKLTHRICKDKKTGQEYEQYGFQTSCYDYFKNIRMYFYSPIKKINRKQLNKLDKFGLAIWYLDDGCLSFIKKNGEIKGRQLILNTQSFSLEEHEIIVNYFKETYDIICHIHKDKDKYRIWMNGSYAYKFLQIIKDVIPSCMYYKLCYRYYGYKSSLNICGQSCNQDCPFNII